jgi:voltage-gated potassium channel Kch
VGTTVLEFDSDHVEVLRRLGLKVFYGDASRDDLLRAAGMDKAKLIILAIDDHKKILEMIETIRRHAPHLTILARATGRTEAYALLDAGVEHVYRETFQTSLRMGIDALSLLGVRAHHAHRMAKTFRLHDEEALRELSGMRHDQKQYLTLARQSISDLEQLLLSELEDTGVSRDAGWDTDSLRQEADQVPEDPEA